MKTDIFTQVKALLYKHVMDSGQKISCPCDPKVLEVNSSGGSS